ncbi:MAG: hypothetical protein A2Y62_13410 [Candidatus Fischerbacteria bacterium RBG_13_37_8]|uniref:Amidohydrolase 3 domain-containing protein n=1 Tax=Candidatus Fischerbacteria bacterium RBG_13_37_8 TaxID=1817863 RepID=A0A1F5VJL1_9BACT|nr:MAG: hypothetical protein A2Y62_13410 [Candidatus Fischerbacteria bacterium RBG_13_37_8]
MALNYSTLVGHGAIRGAAMGFNDRPPTKDELEKMKMMVEENIENGAVGLSTGLEYAPGSYAQPEEITELCKVAARLGGVYATHMRDEGDRLLESKRTYWKFAGESPEKNTKDLIANANLPEKYINVGGYRYYFYSFISKDVMNWSNTSREEEK